MNSSMSVTNVVIFTTSARLAPAAARAVLMFSHVWTIWARMSPLPTTWPFASRESWPARKTSRRPSTATTCE